MNVGHLTEPQTTTAAVIAVLSTAATGRLGFQSAAQAHIDCDFEGIANNRHRGFLRKADARVPYLKRGTAIRNQRQLSVVSVEDLREIAHRLSLPAAADPALMAAALGANVIVCGVPALSYLPRGTKLFFPGQAILIAEDQNAPCSLAGEALMVAVSAAIGVLPNPDHKRRFAKEAVGLRGLVCTVEHPGRIAAGDLVTARIPAQWIYGGKRPG
jgi:hypothetical protein